MRAARRAGGEFLIHRAALAGLLAGAAVPALAAPPARPNIVVIIADDWGFSDPGSFGGEIATPAIDALAAEGTRLANFHVAASCAPSRAMLLTGRDHHLVGEGNMPETMPPEHQGRPGYRAALDPGTPTLASRLRAAGYATAIAGKWHLGHGPDGTPDRFGFERSFALTQSGADNFADKPNLLLYRRADWVENGKPARLPRGFYSSRLIVDTAIRQFDAGRREGKPVFAVLGFLANHIPVQAPDADIARYAARYRAGWTALRHDRAAGVAAKGLLPAVPMVTMRSTPDWAATNATERERRARAMAAYGGMASAMDREVGRLVRHLKARGDYSDTVFVFVSDNGAEATDPMIDAFQRWNVDRYYDTASDRQGRPGSFTAIGAAWASAAAAPLRGYKFSAWEGGLRVPAIIAWPGNPALPKGNITRGFAHATDVAPTLLGLAGVAGDSTLTGRNLLPMLAGRDDAHGPGEAIGYELSGNAALFRGRLKLVKNLPPYGDGRWHLFDIAADPGETRDLAAARPADVAAMQAEHARWAKANGVLPMPAGYSAPAQIEANALRDLLVPRLAPLLGAVAALLLGLLTTRAWRHQ